MLPLKREGSLRSSCAVMCVVDCPWSKRRQSLGIFASLEDSSRRLTMSGTATKLNVLTRAWRARGGHEDSGSPSVGMVMTVIATNAWAGTFSGARRVADVLKKES